MTQAEYRRRVIQHMNIEARLQGDPEIPSLFPLDECVRHMKEAWSWDAESIIALLVQAAVDDMNREGMRMLVAAMNGTFE